MKDARLIALGTEFLFTQNRYSTDWENLYLCQNAWQYTAYATVFTLQNLLPFYWIRQKYYCLAFIIRENKTWTLLLVPIGIEFKSSTRLKMFGFVLNGSFVSCELCCSVCKAAKSICTRCEKAFLLNSMLLQQKNSKWGIVLTFLVFQISLYQHTWPHTYCSETISKEN